MADEARASRLCRLFVITVPSGTGKRSAGWFLAAEHGFRHVDLPGWPERRSELDALLAARDGATGKDIVVTCPDACPTEQLELLCFRGLEWFWFDGDRGATRPRGTTAEPKFVDPFEPNGSFRSVAAVVAELLESRTPRASRRARPISTGATTMTR
jgi:hypothetical protein